MPEIDYNVFQIDFQNGCTSTTGLNSIFVDSKIFQSKNKRCYIHSVYMYECLLSATRADRM